MEIRHAAFLHGWNLRREAAASGGRDRKHAQIAAARLSQSECGVAPQKIDQAGAHVVHRVGRRLVGDAFGLLSGAGVEQFTGGERDIVGITE